MLEILQKNNKLLREKTAELTLDQINSAKIKKLVAEMKETLAARDDGAALAAPQVGESLKLFIVSKKVFQDKRNSIKEDLIFINPEITKQSKEKEWVEEGCLSVEGIFGLVNRSKKCTIKAYNEKRELIIRNGSGLLSQIFQHEVDHLNGILFIDKAKDLKSINESDKKL